MPVESEIVGRDTQFQQLTAFLDDAPGVLLLDGPTGIGKTTLWRWAVETVAGRSFRVLTATPLGSEVALSFAGLGDLLGPVAGIVAPELPPPQRAALAGALLLAEPKGDASDQAAVAAACLSAFRALAVRGPTLVAIDDVQWMDPPSAQVLAFASRRLTSEPVWLLLARRTSTMDQPPPWELDRASSVRPLQRVTLGALSLGALHRLLRSRLGTSLSRPMLVRLHEASAGNPMYALELARWAVAHEGELEPGRPLPLPPTLKGLIEDRLGGQSRRVRAALAAVAALARPTVAAIDDGFALDAAHAAGLVEMRADQVAFTHPLIAAAAYQALGPAERRALHARLARIVADPEERARHLGLAAGGPRADVAATLEGAAARAATRGAPNGAAQLMELAVRLTPPRSAALARRRLAWAELLEVSGDHRRAQALYSVLVAELRPGAKRARALFGQAASADVSTAFKLHEQALAEAGQDLELRSRIHADVSVLSLVAGDVAGARRNARRALADARTSNDHAARAAAQANLGLMDALAGVRHPTAFWMQALAHEAAAGTTDEYGPRQVYGMTLMYADRLDEARGLMVEARRDAIERGRVSMQAGLDLHLTELECRAGNLDAARAYAEDGYTLTVVPNAGQPEGGSLYALALVSMYQGRVDEARGYGAEGLAKADAFGDRIFRAQNLAVLGYLELSLDDAAAAYRHLEGVAEELVAAGYGEPSVYPVLPNTIEALLRTGRAADGLRLLSVLERQGRRLNSGWALAQAARYRGLVAAEDGKLEAALGHFRTAFAEHARLPGPFERGRTLLAFGQVLRRAKRRREARAALTEAMALFDGMGSPLWLDRAREELSRVGGRRAEPGLTPTERRVAELVARGLSNKEAAAALFVTVSSVERHLTRIYEKLGVASRVELARTIGSSSA